MNKIYPEKILKLESDLKHFLELPYLTHGVLRTIRQLRKELSLFKNHLDGINELSKKILNTQKIQIGGGNHLLTDFINIDIKPPADIIYDVREGLPLPDECSNLIFSEHFLEHIDYPISSKKFIRECYRCLKIGGSLIVGVPDGKMQVDNYISSHGKLNQVIIKNTFLNRNFDEHLNTPIDLLNLQFRDQDDNDKYTPHFWTYDFEKLVSLLSSIGFLHINSWDFDDKIANKKRKNGSVYVVGYK